RRFRQAVLERGHARFLGLLRLVADIDLAGRVLAHQHHGQPRGQTFPGGEIRDGRADPLAKSGGKGLSIDKLFRVLAKVHEHLPLYFRFLDIMLPILASASRNAAALASCPTKGNFTSSLGKAPQGAGAAPPHPRGAGGSCYAPSAPRSAPG